MISEYEHHAVARAPMHVPPAAVPHAFPTRAQAAAAAAGSQAPQQSPQRVYAEDFFSLLDALSVDGSLPACAALPPPPQLTAAMRSHAGECGAARPIVLRYDPPHAARAPEAGGAQPHYALPPDAHGWPLLEVSRYFVLCPPPRGAPAADAPLAGAAELLELRRYELVGTVFVVEYYARVRAPAEGCNAAALEAARRSLQRAGGMEVGVPARAALERTCVLTPADFTAQQLEAVARTGAVAAACASPSSPPRPLLRVLTRLEGAAAADPRAAASFFYASLGGGGGGGACGRSAALTFFQAPTPLVGVTAEQRQVAWQRYNACEALSGSSSNINGGGGTPVKQVHARTGSSAGNTASASPDLGAGGLQDSGSSEGENAANCLTSALVAPRDLQAPLTLAYAPHPLSVRASGSASVNDSSRSSRSNSSDPPRPLRVPGGAAALPLPTSAAATRCVAAATLGDCGALAPAVSPTAFGSAGSVPRLLTLYGRAGPGAAARLCGSAARRLLERRSTHLATQCATLYTLLGCAAAAPDPAAAAADQRHNAVACVRGWRRWAALQGSLCRATVVNSMDEILSHCSKRVSGRQRNSAFYHATLLLDWLVARTGDDPLAWVCRYHRTAAAAGTVLTDTRTGGGSSGDDAQAAEREAVCSFFTQAIVVCVQLAHKLIEEECPRRERLFLQCLPPSARMTPQEMHFMEMFLLEHVFDFNVYFFPRRVPRDYAVPQSRHTPASLTAAGPDGTDLGCCGGGNNEEAAAAAGGPESVFALTLVDALAALLSLAAGDDVNERLARRSREAQRAALATSAAASHGPGAAPAGGGAAANESCRRAEKREEMLAERCRRHERLAATCFLSADLFARGPRVFRSAAASGPPPPAADDSDSDECYFRETATTPAAAGPHAATPLDALPHNYMYNTFRFPPLVAAVAIVAVCAELTDVALPPLLLALLPAEYRTAPPAAGTDDINDEDERPGRQATRRPQRPSPSSAAEARQALERRIAAVLSGGADPAGDGGERLQDTDLLLFVLRLLVRERVPATPTPPQHSGAEDDGSVMWLLPEALSEVRRCLQYARGERCDPILTRRHQSAV